jgi:4-oxalocrotonate tautomerase
MPHLVVKLASGRSDADKARLGERLTQAVQDALGYGPESVSIVLDEIPMSEWMSKVYEPEIVPIADQLLKRPGYGPLADIVDP